MYDVFVSNNDKIIIIDSTYSIIICDNSSFLIMYSLQKTKKFPKANMLIFIRDIATRNQ